MKSTQEVIPRIPSQAGTGCWAGKQLKNERWRSSTKQASTWCSPSAAWSTADSYGGVPLLRNTEVLFCVQLPSKNSSANNTKHLIGI